ncbi:MAG: hypothetical protein ACLFRM_02005 [Guyparkeria sp.]|uniref:hypothetical protein n=1 Tax=Guyparkeria sp. TaxID=2035736 RepID=UPI003979B905
MNSRKSTDDGAGDDPCGAACDGRGPPPESVIGHDDEAALWHIFFERNRDGIVILREDGSVYCANQRFAEMHGNLCTNAMPLWLCESFVIKARCRRRAGGHVKTSQHRARATRQAPQGAP